MINKHLEIKRFRVVILITMFFGISFLNNCTVDKEKVMQEQAELLLGITFPDEVTEFQFVKIQESTEYTKPYTAYIRGRMSESAYLDLVHNLELTFKQDGVETKYSILLLSLLRSTESSPTWWDPDPEANELSSAGKFQKAKNEGWIISTYHEGYAYLKVFEEGSP